MATTLLLNDDHGVRTITLNHPEIHNAFNAELIAELTHAIEAAGKDPSVRAVVLTGAGVSFSAGADLNWMRDIAKASEEQNRADAAHLALLMRRVQFCPKPTIARVNGSAFGGGLGLIACCDIAIGVISAHFGLTEVKLGLVPGVISPYVTAAIGIRQTRKLFLTGELIDAKEAHRIGLLHHIVADDQLDAMVHQQLKHLAKAGPHAVHEAKRLAFAMAGLNEFIAQTADLENAKLIAHLRTSPEAQEGLSAFLEKRSPSWA